MDARPVLERIAGLAPRRGFTLVGVGGRGGSGKSTLARSLPGAQVVGTDEFWDGAAFDLGRLRAEVFVPLLAGTAPRYRSYDWEARRRRPTARVVDPSGLIVIEGVCALHRLFRDDYDLRVWVEAAREIRLERGIARDGEAARATWVEVWMPMEDRYVERDDPVSAADVIVDGSGDPP
jgi:uridine kinase